MKSFTDIPQSIKLAKILPIVSADMWYSHYGHPGYNSVIAYNEEQWFLCQIRNSYHDDIPCWSLAALLNVLHDYTLQTNSDGGVFVVCDSKKPMISKSYRNPVDACVELILRLKEKNVL